MKFSEKKLKNSSLKFLIEVENIKFDWVIPFSSIFSKFHIDDKWLLLQDWVLLLLKTERGDNVRAEPTPLSE